MSSKSLDDALGFAKDKISDCIKTDGSIFVMTHMDCDGLAAGGIMAKALIRAGARYTTSTIKEFGEAVIKFLKSRSQDLCIVTDLGGGFGGGMSRALGDKWIIIDHHQIPGGNEEDNPNVINAWKYGIDGGKEISAGGMSYMVAESLDRKNSDLSTMAVVSALGDGQDQGERRSLVGQNFEISETAKRQGLLDVDIDLLLFGRETKPLADALAFTPQPFIDGLTWNRDACHSLLSSSGIRLKDGGRWRIPAELDEDEKKRVIRSVFQFASAKNADEIRAEMIGYTYTFPKEDGRSFLRDGREFSAMLNSCGRMGRAGIGLAICMGDRSQSLQEGESILADYRMRIKKYVNILSNERWRSSTNGPYMTVNAQDVVPETMSGTVCSTLAGSPKNANMIIILWTNAEEESTIKFSARRSFAGGPNVNLNELMGKTAVVCDGSGGGHSAAAGAKITKDKLDEFLRILDENVTEMQGTNRD